jgi:formylglycine-generating enzyme required for sulfatase activity
VFTYHFGYQRIAGIDHRVGADGPWEVKRVLGTVPVEADGSAYFRIPARTPISVQPLDAQGHALQLMRSWMTAMPGEVLSCVGCHESQNSAPPNRATLAMGRGPSSLEPWYGPVRGFSFQREVQPVLDKYCVGCHSPTRLPNGAGGHAPDLRRDQNAVYAYRHGDPELKLFRDTPVQKLMPKFRGIFPPSYIALRSFVRVGGLESDLHLQPPKEFHAETSELFQMLRKGHYNVQLDAEAWDRLATWLDLNAPCHGTWSEFTRIAGDQRKRRLALRALYGGVAEDHEDIPSIDRPPAAFVKPQPSLEPAPRPVEFPGWPLDPSEARRRQEAVPGRTLDLGGGVALELVGIPAGSFGMGATDGHRDERPPRRVDIGEPFLIGKFEVTNEQYRRLDPHHDSRFEHRTSWIFEEEYLGWLLNHPKQPVVRVSWEQAMAFCRWLSKRTGLTVSLPTEAQWEYACRAGTAKPLSYGDLDTDFSEHANMADHTIRDLAYDAWRPLPPDIAPRDARFNDGKLVTADVGSYRPNAWGLHDMHGNAWEWTRSAYRPYPYRPDDGRNDETKALRRVVRGGSWYDRPKRCRSAFRLSYPQYQRVFNVGFRVVVRIE